MDLYDNPVILEKDCEDYPKSVRTTCGNYAIKYIPESGKFRNDKYPYVFINDMLPMRICVSGPRHLEHLAERIPEIGWILRNSNYSSGLFHWALWHPGLKIPFVFDVVKYCDKIERKAKAMGIPNTSTNEFKPLVNFGLGRSDSIGYLNGKKAWLPKANAYNKIIAEYMQRFEKDGE